MSKRPISLKTLAQTLNVSISTVSRALRNHHGISPELTQQVQQLARELNYSPNPMAMGLLKNATRIIGVIVPDLATHFFASIISGIESVANERGYYIVIRGSYESFEREKECVSNLLKLRVEGIIMCLAQETATYDHFDAVLAADIPLVFFDRVCRAEEVPTVVVDNQAAACHITRHFAAQGRRRIAHIAGPPALNISQERVAGYREGLAAEGLPFDENLLERCDLTAPSATAATQRLLALPNPPDAIFGINDTTAFAAMKEIKRQGQRIPADLALVGFTDEYYATVVEPALTSVMHPTFKIGRTAAQLFLDQATAKTHLPPRQVVMETQLVIRESSVVSPAGNS